MDSNQYGLLVPAKPPRPPPRRESFSHSLSWLLHFLFNTISFLLCIIFVLGFALWLNHPKVQVYANNSFLTNLTLNTTANDTFLISYDMSLNFTVTNPSTYTDVYFDDVETSAFLHGEYLFAKVMLPPFYQKHKTTITLEAVLQGSQTLSFGSNREYLLLYRFGEEERARVYNIVVGLALSVQTKYGNIKINVPYNLPYIYCDLMVPLNSMNGKLKSLDYGSEPTKCDMRDGLYN